MRSTRLQSSILTLIAAVLAGLAVWGIARLAGFDPEVERNGDVNSILVVDVVMASLVGGFLAWGAHWLVSTRLHLARCGPFVGSTALAISMIGPSYFADGSSAMVLMLIHLAVGATLIWGFAQQDRQTLGYGRFG